MRLRRLVRWVVVLGILAWIASVIVYAGASYLEASELLEASLNEAARRRQAALAMGQTPTIDDMAADVRATVIRAARRTGLQIDERAMVVAGRGNQVGVRVTWSYPALVLGDRTVISIPMSVERALTVP